MVLLGLWLWRDLCRGKRVVSEKKEENARKEEKSEEREIPQGGAGSVDKKTLLWGGVEGLMVLGQAKQGFLLRITLNTCNI
ncbi:hypothetical protein Y1Q_0004203 [Alligator mississippiensis]|uniref:Uncharacterized protein n=1 Tax=Alligator mississippiensis TaxID=8496 RepID=A0A151NVQ9_ALLMI|nr:hypothetical protein Y1Q_0004203 [Alligator mississippiensis]